MSDMLSRYSALRMEGLGHFAALDELARQTGIDRSTVERVIRSAQKAP